jgi:hypothetical protein
MAALRRTVLPSEMGLCAPGERTLILRLRHGRQPRLIRDMVLIGEIQVSAEKWVFG